MEEEKGISSIKLTLIFITAIGASYLFLDRNIVRFFGCIGFILVMVILNQITESAAITVPAPSAPAAANLSGILRKIYRLFFSKKTEHTLPNGESKEMERKREEGGAPKQEEEMNRLKQINSRLDAMVKNYQEQLQTLQQENRKRMEEYQQEPSSLSAKIIAQNRELTQYKEEWAMQKNKIKELSELNIKIEADANQYHQENQRLNAAIQNLRSEKVLLEDNIRKLEARLSSVSKQSIIGSASARQGSTTRPLIYASDPQNNTFHRLHDQFVPHETRYIIRPINATEGEFELVKDPETREAAFMYIDSLKDACELYGTDRPNKVRYRNGEFGKVRKEGDYWVITKKLPLEWD
jgi:hypothetical protein